MSTVEPILVGYVVRWREPATSTYSEPARVNWREAATITYTEGR